MMKYSFAAATLAAFAGLTLSASAQNWDMPVRNNERNYLTQNIEKFVEEVAAATDGQLKITVHPEDALVRQPDVKGAVQTGQVQIGDYLLSLHSNESPLFNIESIPFLSNSYEEARRLADAARPAIAEKLATQNIRLLFVAPWPPQAIYTRQEVRSLADVSGIKFRAYNPITARMAELMGALPVTVQQSEVPQAFSTGIIQAMITSPATGVDTQAWDFVGHYADTRAMIPWNVVIVNEQMFQSLEPAVRDAVLAAASAAEERVWQVAPAENDKLVGILRDNGMEIHEPSDELRGELQTIGQTLLDEWLDAAGDEGRAIIDAYRQGG